MGTSLSYRGAMVTRPLSNDDLKAAVREEYEQTDISVAGLAKRHGLKSKTTIVRWIRNEGWTRDPEENRARIVIAADERTPPPPPSAAAEAAPKRRGKARKEPSAAAPASPSGTGHATDTPPDTASPFQAGEGDDDPRYRSHLRDETAQGSESRANRRQRVSETLFEGVEGADVLPDVGGQVDVRDTLKAIHAKSTRRQLVMAERMRSVAGALLLTLEDVLVGEGLEFMEAKQRLTALNAFESMAALTKACAGLMEGSALMERRAIGLEVPRQYQLARTADGLPAAEDVAVSEPIRQVLSGISESALLELRRMTVEVHRLQLGPGTGTTIEGTAEPVPQPSKETAHE